MLTLKTTCGTCYNNLILFFISIYGSYGLLNSATNECFTVHERVFLSLRKKTQFFYLFTFLKNLLLIDRMITHDCFFTQFCFRILLSRCKRLGVSVTSNPKYVQTLMTYTIMDEILSQILSLYVHCKNKIQTIIEKCSTVVSYSRACNICVGAVQKKSISRFLRFYWEEKKISIAFDDVVFMRKFSNKRFKPIYWTFLSSWNCGPREQTCWLSIGFYSFFFLLHTFFEYCYTVKFANFCFVLKRLYKSTWT